MLNFQHFFSILITSLICLPAEHSNTQHWIFPARQGGGADRGGAAALSLPDPRGQDGLRACHPQRRR